MTDEQFLPAVELADPADIAPTKAVAASDHSHVRAAVVVAGGLVLAGVAVGALWAAIAPAIRSVIADTRDNGRVHVYLGDQADNFFVSTTLLVGMTTVLAVVAAVAAWQWRAYRGPAMVWGLTLGALAAAGSAAGVGAALALMRYGRLDVAGAQLDEGHKIKYVVEAPAVFYGHSAGQIAVTLLAAPLAAAAVYAFCVVACPRDDLGVVTPAPETSPTVAVGPAVEGVGPS